MKPETLNQDIALLQQALLLLGVETNTTATKQHTHTIELYFICNTSGSMRWVWPAGLNIPQFLRFYHSSHWRAILFVWTVRLLFAIGAKRLLAHGKLTLFTNQYGQGIIYKIWKNNWSVFTGTEGPNRKMLHWHKGTADAGIFTKIALTNTAQQNLQNELSGIQHVQQQPLRLVKTPIIAFQHPAFLQLHELTGYPCRQTHHIAQLPVPALQEWLTHNLQTVPLIHTQFWKNAQQNIIQALPQCHRHPLLNSLQKKLQQLAHHLQQTVTAIPASGAHADFTPWNLRIINNQYIGLFDFELYQPQMPALYDLFHFVYQSGILITHKNYRSVKTQIDRLLQQPQWQQFIQLNNLNTSVLEQCYLLYNISYYLYVYAMQPTWHTQVYWLLQVWNDALNHHLLHNAQANARQLLLADLPHLLQKHPHAIMKLRVNKLDELPFNADIDICLPQYAAQKLLRDLNQHPAIARINILNLTYMKQAELLLKNNTALYIDLIWQFKRKHLQFLSAPDVWKHAQAGGEAGVNIPSTAHEFAYIWLFYHLNRAAIPAHYCQLLHNRLNDSITDIAQINELTQQILPNEKDHNEVFSGPTADTTAKLTKYLLQQTPNKGWRRWLNCLAYGWDTVRQFFTPRGKVFTFSGVDGAGKSTVIQQLKTRLEKEHRKRVVVLRHRPSLLPILSAFKHGRQKAEKIAAATLPRQGKNQSALSSVLRFTYYYTDYVVGQFYVYLRYTCMGYIVLYDRYYFDFITDSKRSNIHLPQKVVTRLYRFLLKPHFNFFLYAPPAQILERKQELSAATIKQLTSRYLQLFAQLEGRYGQSRYIALQNTNLTETLNNIMYHIQNPAT